MTKRKYKTYKIRIYEENSKEVADNLWQEYLLKVDQSLDGFIRRYGEPEGIIKYDIFRNKSKHTKEKYIMQLGKIAGEKRWDEYIQTKRETTKRAFAYWLKICDGDYDLARKQYADYQRRDMDYFINKYGKKIGMEKWNSKNKKQSISISKHHKNNKNKQLHAATLSKWIKKYGQEIGAQKWKELLLKKSSSASKTSVSEVSQSFCDSLLDMLHDDFHKYIKYAKKNKEWWIYDRNKKSYLFFDFTLIKSGNKKIIEFNGDFWHANPLLFESDWKHPILKTDAKRLWDKDRYKLRVANNSGFDTLVVWEKEWRDNKEKVLIKCKKFIEGENNECS